jgi:hypothetical protein
MYRYRGCRCDACRAAHSQETMRYRRGKGRKARKSFAHGTSYARNVKRCSCAICVASVTRHRPKPSQGRPSARHGTPYKFWQKGCRCERCCEVAPGVMQAFCDPYETIEPEIPAVIPVPEWWPKPTKWRCCTQIYDCSPPDFPGCSVCGSTPAFRMAV